MQLKSDRPDKSVRQTKTLAHVMQFLIIQNNPEFHQSRLNWIDWINWIYDYYHILRNNNRLWDYEGLHNCLYFKAYMGLQQWMEGLNHWKGCCCVKFVSEWEAGPVNRAEPYNPSRWASLVQYDPNLQAFVGKRKAQIHCFRKRNRYVLLAGYNWENKERGQKHSR